jgi:DNA segregation ATPase FtsK/SpoIIIE, S-DNA-T family
MQCNKCGNDLPRKGKYCSICGNPTGSLLENSNEQNDNSVPNDKLNKMGSSGYGTATQKATVDTPAQDEIAKQSHVAEMYQHMRGLLRHIKDDLIVPCAISIAEAENRRDRRKKEHKDAWQANQTELKRRLDNAANNHRLAQQHSLTALNYIKSVCLELEQELQETTEKVSAHFTQQRLLFPFVTLMSPPFARETNPAEMVAKYKEELKEHTIELMRFRKPEFLWWQGTDFGVTAAIALIVGLIISASTTANTYQKGEDFLITFILSFVIIAIGLLASIYILRKYFATNKLMVLYKNWLQAKELALFWHNHYLRQAEESYKRETAGQEKTLLNEQARCEESLKTSENSFQQRMNEAELDYRKDLATNQSIYLPLIDEAQKLCAQFYLSSGYAGADWGDNSWGQWHIAKSPALGFRIGHIATKSANLMPVWNHPQLQFSIPAILSFLNGKCLLFQATAEAKKKAIEAIQSVMLRLLATIPPGKLRFTLIDPIGLGQNVALFMPLADHDESLIGGKAWTEPQHIEQRLSEITEHMETVIQKYLRKDYPTIEDYNTKAGEVAEPYRALVVVDFPVNFNADAARRLVSIAQNGSRCGVHTFVIRDTSKPLPYGFTIADLEQHAHVITTLPNDSPDNFLWIDDELNQHSLTIDSAPTDEVFKTVIARTGEKAKSGMVVEVPYSKLLQTAELEEPKWWEAKTNHELKVPMGPAGARKAQYLTMGKGMAHHAVIIGRTGSGKSNLMHVIIVSLALNYSPDEIQLYLIDFKQGVEFKPYAVAELPHAKVIAIESEREFGMSVLQGLVSELKRRSEIFKSVNAQNIAQCKEKMGKDFKLPRILLVVDEFQEFFIADDKITRDAGIALDTLVRQGRSYGIHIMLGSQTLAGYKLPGGLIGQMAIRIALQCSSADSRLILADDNPAARLLSRPGEAYYNDQGGLIEGNNLFQVAMFKEQDRDFYLDAINRKAANSELSFPPPIVFEGNKPAHLKDCKQLNDLIAATSYPLKSKNVDTFLGEAIAISPPVAAHFRRQEGRNMLIVTRDEAEGIGMLTSVILSLATQKHPRDAQINIIDFSTVDTEWANLSDELSELLPHRIRVVRRRELSDFLSDMYREINQRLESGHIDAEEIYLIFQGIHRMRDLRAEEPAAGSYSARRTGEEKPPTPHQMFLKIVKEGADLGVHTIIWSDTLANLMKTDRNLLRDLGMRVSTGMTNEESNKMFDEPIAAKLDKPHRAIFFDEERTGAFEKFRPYAIPDKEWLRKLSEQLSARSK